MTHSARIVWLAFGASMILSWEPSIAQEAPSPRIELQEASSHLPDSGHVAANNPMEVSLHFFLEFATLLVAAKIGGHIAPRLKQPSVLGELGVGIFLAGLLPLIFPESVFSKMIQSATQPDSDLDMLAQMGVVLLLFSVGVESNLGELLKVGRSALSVALLGVVVPMVTGMLICQWLTINVPPGVSPIQMHVFIGATIAATSVGITARVFEELDCLDRREARVVLGAAVIDDILGLIVLALVSGTMGANQASTEDPTLAFAGLIALKAVAFIVLSLVLGSKLAPIYTALKKRSGWPCKSVAPALSVTPAIFGNSSVGLGLVLRPCAMPLAPPLGETGFS